MAAAKTDKFWNKYTLASESEQSDMLQEEQDALKSMFCFPGECSVQGNREKLKIAVISGQE